MLRPLIPFLPGFKASCLTVGVLNLLIVGGLFAKGLMVAMGEYAVPQAQLDSAHYYDAIFWVYVHMLLIGLLIAALGIWVRDGKAQLWLSRVLCGMHVVYMVLDFRSSDSPLGNGLYQGAASLIPAFICVFFVLLFLNLSLGKVRQGNGASAS